MPGVEIPIEKWTGKIREVKLGGGKRKEIVLGGENTLPFLSFEGSVPHPPRVGIEIQDREPAGWSSSLLSAWGDAVKDPATWAKKAAEYGAEAIALRLVSAHPEMGNTGAAEAKKTVDKVLAAVDLPLIVIGAGVAEKDNAVLVAVSETAKGQRIAIGNCEEKNYRTVAAVCISDGHVAIAKSPLDINLAKQLNILLTDIGVPADSILMDVDTGALGYGLEYALSIRERVRLAALGGDAMVNMPVISHSGAEAWRQKEAKASQGIPAAWGAVEERGLVWEELTALTVINAGSNLVTLLHPKSVERMKATIQKLMGKK
jgi:acetyl-CoA decarbonylase/synthase, CODH/ACS complex subunit delta